MLSPHCLGELRSSWLPNITETGLERLLDLLQKSSPLLVAGCFTRAVPMGCLASHIAWNHPRTSHLTIDAGITWLHQVAGLNPATSQVLREWDRRGAADLTLRADLIAELKAELLRGKPTSPPAPLARRRVWQRLPGNDPLHDRRFTPAVFPSFSRGAERVCGSALRSASRLTRCLSQPVIPRRPGACPAPPSAASRPAPERWTPPSVPARASARPRRCSP